MLESTFFGDIFLAKYPQSKLGIPKTEESAMPKRIVPLSDIQVIASVYRIAKAAKQ